MDINLKSKKELSLWAAIVGINTFGFELYDGQYYTFVNSYAHDLLIPASAYFLYKTFNLFGENKYVNAAFCFLGCSAFEVAQGLGWYHGTFDLNDFIAYASGAGLALGIDGLISRKKQES